MADAFSDFLNKPTNIRTHDERVFVVEEIKVSGSLPPLISD